MVCGVLKDCSAHLWAKGAASAIPGVIFASKMRNWPGEDLRLISSNRCSAACCLLPV
jgi:hypothetical protein